MDEENENSPYQIEEIVDSKKDENGKAVYKARYVKYAWLTEENLEPYLTLLNEYLSKIKKAIKTSKTSSSVNATFEECTLNLTIDEAPPSVNAETKIDDVPTETEKKSCLTSTVLTEKKNKKRSLRKMITQDDNMTEESAGPWRSKRLKENVEKLSSFYCKQCRKSFRTEDIYTAHVLDHDLDAVARGEETLSEELFEITINGKKKEYKCQICSHMFKEKRDATSHQKIHNGTNPWYCEECDKHFLRKHKYARHILIHTGTKNHECDECGKKFNGPDYLRRHKLTYCTSSRGQFQCAICDEIFSEKRLLEAHIAIHDGTNPFYCIECDKYFLKRNIYENHMSLHANYRPYECSTCGKTFVAKGDYNRHLRQHDDDIFQCHRCEETYSLQEDLEMHYQMSENCAELVCTECNVEFPAISDLRNHLQSYAAGSSPEDPSGAVYLCRFCQRGFHVHATFLQHRSIHVRERLKRCDHCDTDFDSRDQLSKHIKTVHSRSMTYACVECGKVFDDNSNLKRHTKTAHAKETTYRCLPCSKTFYVRSDLNQHLLTKQHVKTVKENLSSGQKLKLRCPVCEKIFQSVGELKRHEFFHQRVQVNPRRDLLFNDKVVDFTSSPATTFYTEGVYTIDGGEQVILTEQQATLLNARFNMGSSGKFDFVYLKRSGDGDIVEDEVPTDLENIGCSRDLATQVSPTDDINIPVDADENPVITMTSAENGNILSRDNGVFIQISNVPMTANATADDDVANVTVVERENKTGDEVEECNEETFLALSQIIQQGQLDVSGLQVIQNIVTPTEEIKI